MHSLLNNNFISTRWEKSTELVGLCVKQVRNIEKFMQSGESLKIVPFSYGYIGIKVYIACVNFAGEPLNSLKILAVWFLARWPGPCYCFSVSYWVFSKIRLNIILEECCLHFITGLNSFCKNRKDFWKQKILKFLYKRTNNVHGFEDYFLRGQVSSNGLVA